MDLSRPAVRILLGVATALAAATTALVAVLANVVWLQARAARRAIGKPLGEQAHVADEVYKKKYGDPIDLLLLGDSIAAGPGAGRPEEDLRRPARQAGRQEDRAHRAAAQRRPRRLGDLDGARPARGPAVRLPRRRRSDRRRRQRRDPPSGAGYRRTAKAMLPSVLDALGYEQVLPSGHYSPGEVADRVRASSPGGHSFVAQRRQR